MTIRTIKTPHPLDRAEAIRDLASAWVNRPSGVDHISDVYDWIMGEAERIEEEYRAKEYKPTPGERERQKAAELRALEMGYPA